MSDKLEQEFAELRKEFLRHREEQDKKIELLMARLARASEQSNDKLEELFVRLIDRLTTPQEQEPAAPAEAPQVPEEPVADDPFAGAVNVPPPVAPLEDVEAIAEVPIAPPADPPLPPIPPVPPADEVPDADSIDLGDVDIPAPPPLGAGLEEPLPDFASQVDVTPPEFDLPEPATVDAAIELPDPTPPPADPVPAAPVAPPAPPVDIDLPPDLPADDVAPPEPPLAQDVPPQAPPPPPRLDPRTAEVEDLIQEFQRDFAPPRVPPPPSADEPAEGTISEDDPDGRLDATLRHLNLVDKQQFDVLRMVIELFRRYHEEIELLTSSMTNVVESSIHEIYTVRIRVETLETQQERREAPYK